MVTHTFSLLWILLAQAASDPPLEVVIGQNVTLQCVAGDAFIIAVEWTRDDLGPSEYVLFYRDGHTDPTHQHSSFKGRVQLADEGLKDGNISLVLRDSRITDSGTYESRVAGGRSRRQKRSIIGGPPISTIRLKVVELQVDPGFESEGPMWWWIGLAAGLCALVCLSVGFFLVLRKIKRPFNRNSKPSVAYKAAGNVTEPLNT